MPHLQQPFGQAMERFLVPKPMIIAANKFRDCIRKFNYQPFDEKKFTGFWKTITVRYSEKTNDMMLMILSQNSTIKEQIDKLKNQLKATGNNENNDQNILGKIETLQKNLVELKKEEIDQIRQEMLEIPSIRSCIFDDTVLFGDRLWTEQILGYTFEISPESFFQVNRSQCEVLYNKIGEAILNEDENENSNAKKKEKTKKKNILLDICCGTGTIGISLNKNFDQILGLEIVKEAIENAQRNAATNKITNIEYFLGSAEQTLPTAIKPYHDSEIYSVSAILDPPRNGLHFSLINSIRVCQPIKKLVYVSCNIEANRTQQNFVDLTRAPSKRIMGEAFRLVSVTPVDMFPNTNHIENILVFER